MVHTISLANGSKKLLDRIIGKSEGKAFLCVRHGKVLCPQFLCFAMRGYHTYSKEVKWNSIDADSHHGH